ncbi:unnamed protein product [Cuscuta europaea]|uniref:Uncharacterized protein n=1 Tax=Cuscuta europaea TaxID=41803 RepID=A0A9P1E3P4_CUSEU|nr:unnamed protein product [Cuscuta europaea]
MVGTPIDDVCIFNAPAIDAELTGPFEFSVANVQAPTDRNVTASPGVGKLPVYDKVPCSPSEHHSSLKFVRISSTQVYSPSFQNMYLGHLRCLKICLQETVTLSSRVSHFIRMGV